MEAPDEVLHHEQQLKHISRGLCDCVTKALHCPPLSESKIGLQDMREQFQPLKKATIY